MSIKAYVGRMGSGKSYEVVSVVILNALRRGRRVISNIAGLNYEAFCQLLESEGVPREQIGQLVHVEHAQVLQPEFWRTDKDADLGVDAFIQPGDLIALDEVWRFWSGFATKGDDGSKRPDRVMNFFRMHRQFPHPETGVTCDVALITQDIMDISRQVRAVIEETYRMEKLTAVGSTKRYRVDVFQGGKVTRSPLRQLQRSYDPRYFPLYSSHSQKSAEGAEAKEENIDGRGNILQGALFKFIIPAALVFIVGAGYFVFSFFNPKKPAAETAKVEPAKDADPVSHAKQESRKADVTDAWRVVGWYTSNGLPAVVVENQDRRIRVLYDPPAFKVSGMQISVVLPEGGTATTYSGSAVDRTPGGKL